MIWTIYKLSPSKPDLRHIQYVQQKQREISILYCDNYMIYMDQRSHFKYFIHFILAQKSSLFFNYSH